jgi:hypothetical protein
MQKKKQLLLWPATLLLLLLGCKTIATYDSVAFEQTSLLRAKVLVLMDHATEEYTSYAKKADDILVEAERISAMQKARNKNAITQAQWQKLMQKDPLTQESFLPGFFTLWKKKKTLSQTFIDEAKPQVEAAFNEILRLEGAKLKH